MINPTTVQPVSSELENERMFNPTTVQVLDSEPEDTAISNPVLALISQLYCDWTIPILVPSAIGVANCTMIGTDFYVNVVDCRSTGLQYTPFNLEAVAALLDDFAGSLDSYETYLDDSYRPVAKMDPKDLQLLYALMYYKQHMEGKEQLLKSESLIDLLNVWLKLVNVPHIRSWNAAVEYIGRW